LKTRALKLFGNATNRALLHVTTRTSFEPEALVVSAALSGLSLFGKFRSAVRKNRS